MPTAQVLLTSSRDDRGVPELRAAVAKLLEERGLPVRGA